MQFGKPSTTKALVNALCAHSTGITWTPKEAQWGYGKDRQRKVNKAAPDRVARTGLGRGLRRSSNAQGEVQVEVAELFMMIRS